MLLKLVVILLLVKKSFELSFNCDFKYYGGQYTCYAKEVWDVEEARITLINGTHIAEKSDQDVKEFFSTDYIKYFPRNLLEYFPNLISIDMRSSDIAELSPDDLKSYVNLTSIFISRSRISSLQRDLFKFNTNLQYISFVNNTRLRHVDEYLVEDLPYLKKFEFYGNECMATKTIDYNFENEIELVSADFHDSCQYKSNNNSMKSANNQTIDDLEKLIKNQNDVIEILQDKLEHQEIIDKNLQNSVDKINETMEETKLNVKLLKILFVNFQEKQEMKNLEIP